MILDEHARHAVARRGDDVAVVEADLERPGLDFAVPIGMATAETQVPFADDACCIAGILQHRGKRDAARLDDQRRVAGQNAGSFLPPGVFAGEHRVTRRRASGSRRMGIGKAKPFAGEPIDVRRVDCGGAVAARIAVAQDRRRRSERYWGDQPQWPYDDAISQQENCHPERSEGISRLGDRRFFAAHQNDRALFLLIPRQFADEFHFIVAIRPAVGVENVMVPRSGSPRIGICHVLHGYFVCDLPSTKPQQ